MSYYTVCPYCGCNLDPGEACDCEKKEAAASAVNTDNGMVEIGLPTDLSTSYNNKNEWRMQA